MAEQRKVSGQSLVGRLNTNIPDCRLEYMVHNPEVAGSSPAGALFQLHAPWSKGSSP